MKKFFLVKILTGIFVLFCLVGCKTEPNKIHIINTIDKDFAVVAFYHSCDDDLQRYNVEKLTHVVFCFLQIKNNRLTVKNQYDSLAIHKLMRLKARNPDLKIILSVGGWAGCETFSQTFANDTSRNDFALSVRNTLNYFNADGIDIDWEYPVLQGFPGHISTPADKDNFTLALAELRNILGSDYEISISAGGFKSFLDTSVDWVNVEEYLDRVHIMSYDFTIDKAKTTGHHTALYNSLPFQKNSADYAINILNEKKFPLQKLIIGSAFYARLWHNVPDTNNGLYQKAKYLTTIPYKMFASHFTEKDEFTYFWDSVACAPYFYSPKRKMFATFDDKKSVLLKTKYAYEKNLGGIMFWKITDDKSQNGLLDEISQFIFRKKHLF